jgi:iron complex transport system ATP-binding protein
LQRLRERALAQGGALVMAVHDVNLAARFCDHALLIHTDGTMAHGPAAQLLDPEPLSTLYEHPIEAVPWGSGRAFLPG